MHFRRGKSCHALRARARALPSCVFPRGNESGARRIIIFDIRRDQAEVGGKARDEVYRSKGSKLNAARGTKGTRLHPLSLVARLFSRNTVSPWNFVCPFAWIARHGTDRQSRLAMRVRGKAEAACSINGDRRSELSYGRDDKKQWACKAINKLQFSVPLAPLFQTRCQVPPTCFANVRNDSLSHKTVTPSARPSVANCPFIALQLGDKYMVMRVQNLCVEWTMWRAHSREYFIKNSMPENNDISLFSYLFETDTFGISLLRL